MSTHVEKYFRLLFIRTKGAIIAKVRASGGVMGQRELQDWLQTLIQETRELRTWARQDAADAELFVMGALLQLVQERILLVDEENTRYMLTSERNA